MTHRIIVLSDGTGNAASKVWRTNVWRIFEFLDLTGSNQVAKYDDGVGSSSFKPLAILGGAFGWGLKRNVIDLYKFVCRNYRPPSSADRAGSEIYAFGFSRGAFTVRVLIGLILEQGLVPYHSEADLHVRAKGAYRTFRAERFHSVLRIEWVFRKFRNLFVGIRDAITGRVAYTKADNTVVPSIEFIGVWDTVAAYGLPIEEMTRGVSQWIWPLELPNRTLSPKVRRASHALALDDERTTFHPVLWTEKGEGPPITDPAGNCWVRDERISQIWFAGVHSNVGGGYPDDALAHLPLYWIMEEARNRGLIFKALPADPDAFRRAASARDKDGRQYNSRAGLGGYYRYGPRKLADLCQMKLSNQEGNSVQIEVPKIHESVLLRLRSDSNAYAPIGLPAKYDIVTFDGRIIRGASTYESAIEALARAQDQERIWNFVWLRRLVYFLTLAASFHLAVFWLFHDHKAEREFSSPIKLISKSVRLVEAFLPYAVVHWWTDYYAANPVSFALGVIAVGVFIWIGSKLGGRISDSMRIIWKSRAKQTSFSRQSIHKWIYRFRTNKFYQWIIHNSRRHILPFFTAILLLWIGSGVLSHFLFNVADSTGVFCKQTPNKQLQVLDELRETAKDIEFTTRSLCFPTGVYLTKGAKYAISLTVSDSQDAQWSDGSFGTTPKGFRNADLDMWERSRNIAVMPLRRVTFRRWFFLVARVGSSGQDEYFVGQSDYPGISKTSKKYGGTTQTVRRGGELFLYVNEAVIGLPWLNDYFYKNNGGKAQVTVTRL